jgi:hypothetical protein
MMTVRFPTGFSVQYNTAGFVSHSEGKSALYTKQGGQLVAIAYGSCIVELVSPCRTYNPVAPDSDRVQASVELLAKDVRAMKRKLAQKEAKK